mmetsp:Transcript_25968/g.43532  ORF Transcript_25968/g.43532 Transcript_25968/m.43532 type:complete len:347 (+) Transcript_25968:203-1243(+)|eukprot:CAMPEP_0198207064 /NCGR_PEP_ID=MMETSP1445-20131203/10550_1 /TAXON_ID=36898 /ORGANISM="Pyramimonas sp., Strain CCMP2087" /LENGTH=346 /DNA_ID=CAMNT_0043879967 /DNA_START=124 /DNA_END=1164 /DNA_ORIENTATION=+
MPGRVPPHSELGNKISASIREVFSQKLSTNEGERASIAQASQAIEKQATKIAILWKDISCVDEESAQATLQEMLVGCIALHASGGNTYRIMGPTLSEAVLAALVAVGEACASLVEAVTSPNPKQREENLPQFAGVVWERCKAMEKLPKDNRAAVGRALAKTATLVKDIVREINEIDTDKDPAEGKEEDDDDEDDNGDCDSDGNPIADLDFDADFDADELRVVAAAKPLFPAVVDVTRSMVRELAEGSEPADEEELALIEKALTSAKRMMVACESLGASLYPPQDPEELQKHTAEVEEELQAAKVALASRRGAAVADASKSNALDAAAADLQALCAALGTALTLSED